jgi:hypothetical protein
MAKDTTLLGSSRRAPIDTPTSTSNSESPTLVHFPEYASSTSCHLKETDIGDPVDMWQFFLIGYVARKFLGYASLLTYISKN